MNFSNQVIAIGICGGIAAYRVCDLIRELYRRGAKRVIPLMTESAQSFISPLTIEALARENVLSDPLGVDPTDGTPWHIAVAQQADLFLVMPATANTMAKLASGLADDMVSTTALTFTQQPVVIAPAMNTRMWENPITQKNIQNLQSLTNLHFIEPSTGDLACGEYGAGHLASTEAILQGLYQQLHPYHGLLNGQKALVTAGGTQEALDPVRYITNRSSGRMGLAIADELHAMGAEVSLMYTHTNPIERPYEIIHTPTAQTMLSVLEQQFPQCHWLWMSAAVSDFKVAEPAAQKLKKPAPSSQESTRLPLDLTLNPDILTSLTSTIDDPLGQRQQKVIGFAAETHQMEQHAQEKLKRKKLNAIVANDITRPDIGFQSNENEVTLYTAEGEQFFFPRQQKWSIARQLIVTLVQGKPIPEEQWPPETASLSGHSDRVE